MRNMTVFVLKYVLLALIGAALLVVPMFGVIDDFWAGMGAGLLGVCAIRIFQIVRYKTDSEYADRVTVNNGDERNRYLAEKARSRGYYYSILIECVGVIGFRIAGMPEFSTLLGYVVCLQLVIYLVSWFWIRKKY